MCRKQAAYGAATDNTYFHVFLLGKTIWPNEFDRDLALALALAE
jgi:hypothetical protein